MTAPTSSKPTYCSSNQRPISLSFLLVLCVIVLAAGTQLVAQTVTDLYDFTGGGDGFGPNIPITGPDGSIYGTTQSGGNLNCPGGDGLGCGTVFRLAPSTENWAFSTLYEFQGLQDGFGYSTLTLDGQDRLYGATVGGTPWGGVFRMTPRAPGQRWQFDFLYKFTGERDGGNPVSPLLVDSTGTIYGASNEGGLHGKGCDQQFGCGAIFQLLPPAHNDGAWTSNVLYEFQGANDGGNPSSVVMDSTGIIYGTTTLGGDFNSHCALGCGVVFELFQVDGTWAYKVLADFKGEPHQSPANLIRDASGNLYGLVGKEPYGELGDVFELTPPAGGSGPWTLTYPHVFGGNYPATDLIIGADGALDGSIYGDQDFNWGYVLQLSPPAQPAGKWTYTTLANFNPFPYQNPSGVALGLDAYLYATVSGGGYYPGNIVSVKP